MTRLKISIVILCTLIGLSIGSSLLVRGQCQFLLEQLQEVEAAEEAEAFDSCEQFVRQWQKRRELLVYLVRKDRLAEVEAAIVRLGPLLEEQGDEFSAELDTVQILLRSAVGFQHFIMGNRRMLLPFFYRILFFPS